MAGSIATLIGANGACKSTILKAIMGLKSAFSGEILFEDKRIFPQMSVLDNLKIGAYSLKDRRDVNENLLKIFEYFHNSKNNSDLSNVTNVLHQKATKDSVDLHVQTDPYIRAGRVPNTAELAGRDHRNMECLPDIIRLCWIWCLPRRSISVYLWRPGR